MQHLLLLDTELRNMCSMHKAALLWWIAYACLTSSALPGQVEDAGRTEVAPGSQTVLAIGGFSDVVDQVTGKFRTLR